MKPIVQSIQPTTHHAIIQFALLLVIDLLTGCTTLPTDYPKTSSTAINQPVSTGVSGMLQREAAKHPGKSGFAILQKHREAFTQRVALADFAEKTLDIQYYIWSDDTIGSILGERVLKAADRGVRVRFLLDGYNLKNRDSAVAALAAHPMVELRIFNPHQYNFLRVLEVAFNFSRLNKRMHNKLFVMDNSAAIAGGRNIANVDFGLNRKHNNRDLDIFVVGPIVKDISNTFDEFWNSAVAIPIEALVDEPYDLNDFHSQATHIREKIKTGNYPYPLEADLATLRKRTDSLSSRLVWAKGEIIYNSFQSMQMDRKKKTVFYKLADIIDNAHSEVAMESAYFVVRHRDVEFIRELTTQGIKVRSLTNSLASNNTIAAHAGHSKHRKMLIEAGMQLYELRPDAMWVLNQVTPEGKDGTTTLHSKAIVIDREMAFVGSYNLDPRSAEINSEVGVLVNSPVFARRVAAYLDNGVKPQNAYHLTLDDQNNLQWQTIVDGQVKTWSKDPETSFYNRMKVWIFRILPIDNHL